MTTIARREPPWGRHVARATLLAGLLGGGLVGASCARSGADGASAHGTDGTSALAEAAGPRAASVGERADLAARAVAEPLAPGRFPTTVHRPYPGLGLITDRAELSGRPARAPCLTCHGFVEARDENRFASRLDGVHAGVRIVHGGQSCRTCHAVPSFSAYNLADGQAVSYAEVMRLCGQCHARRLLEYEQGVHGGMNGYWDSARGPRDRNHCLDCHNAHAPRVPAMQPAERPHYRSGT
jgi:hypothetical protein